MSEVAEQTRPTLAHRQILLLMGGLMTGLLLARWTRRSSAPRCRPSSQAGRHRPLLLGGHRLPARSTASTPLYGKVSDLYGRRPVLLFAIGTFLVGSLLAGLSRT